MVQFDCVGALCSDLPIVCSLQRDSAAASALHRSAAELPYNPLHSTAPPLAGSSAPQLPPCAGALPS